MSQIVKGITIEIGGETKKLQSAIRQLNSETKSLRSELRGVETLLKMDPKNTTLLQQKQHLLATSINTTKENLNKLKEAQSEADAAMLSGEQISQKEYRNLQREIANTEIKLSTLEQKQREFSSLSAVQLQAVGKEFQTIGEKMSNTGQQLIPLTAGIAAVAAASLKSSIDFESSFAGVKKTVNATSEELNKLAESSRQAALNKPVDVNDINHIKELGGQLRHRYVLIRQI